VADETEIHAAAERLQSLGASVEAVEGETSPQLREWINSMALPLNCPVDALFANAGGLGRAFLDQDFAKGAS
jgi:hypothetical protein